MRVDGAPRARSPLCLFNRQLLGDLHAEDESVDVDAGLEGVEVVVGERLEALADFLRLIGAFRVLGEFLQLADLLFG